MALLQELAVADTWGLVIAVGGCGAVGAVVHLISDEEPQQPWWKVACIGALAAVGLVSVAPPTTGLELIGLSLLGGFFARTILVALESRLTLTLTRQRAERALALAGEAIELSRRKTVATDGDESRLAARLEEVKAFGTSEGK